MHQFTSDIEFTSSVKAVQPENGSRGSYTKMEQTRGFETQVTPRLESFLAEMDMFYLGTSNAEGQPYIQYRGWAYRIPGGSRPEDAGLCGLRVKSAVHYSGHIV